MVGDAVPAMSFIKLQMSSPVQSLTKCFNKTDPQNSEILHLHKLVSVSPEKKEKVVGISYL